MSSFSFIIPTYNNSKKCEMTVNNLIQQLGDKFSDCEVIVVNDGGRDDFSHQFKENVKYFFKENGGVSSARNYGMSKAKNEFIVFLDDDDSFNKNLRQHLSIANGFEATYCGFSKNIDGIVHQMPTKFVTKNVPKNYISGTVYTHLSCWIFRKSIIERNSLQFDEKLNYSEDVLFTFEYLTNISNIGTTKLYAFEYMIDTQRQTLSSFKYTNIEDDINACKAMLEITDINSVKVAIKYYRIPVLLLRYLNSIKETKLKERIRMTYNNELKAKFYKSQVGIKKIIKIYGLYFRVVLRGKR